MEPFNFVDQRWIKSLEIERIDHLTVCIYKIN